ncbi:hypothetical protein SEUCBS139899_009602 [Sporothrix eucalyptigena]|uniref:Uncharacterized protein n=1 Tax=Sporothrix eucalyptigena TaxID=1812306 RepID=A0ABP0CF57_9PEZI
MTEVMPRRSHELFDSITAEDFETASIRSAAPSYPYGVVIGGFRSSAGVEDHARGTLCALTWRLAGLSTPCSEAPTLHYTVPNSGGGSLLPPYTAPPAGSDERVVAPPWNRGSNAAGNAAARRNQVSAASGTAAGSVFAMPSRMDNVRREDIPDLSRFRMPEWSTISTSPNARLYHSVALRRVAAAEHASATAEIGSLLRRLAVLEQMREEEAAAVRRMERANASRAAAAVNINGNGNGAGASGSGSGSNNSNNGNRSSNGGGNNAIGRLSTGNGPFRPLEDPYLVGETAARRARAERLARENLAHGEDALHREDRRWDWFLGQVKNRHGSGRLRRRMDVSSFRHLHGRRV